MENKEQLFGTKAVDSEFKFLSVVKNFFTLQNVKFWLLTYLVSFIIFEFFSSHIILINSVNFILFPFTVIIVGTVANQFVLSISLVYRLMYPTYKHSLSNNQNKVMLIITNIIKFFIYIVLWRYTFILGIAGLIITINNARTLDK
ncbi:putative neutral ceramidase superfamily lipid hydrolase [Salibacterium salarium]|nr:putative neutral ceramidase superfamily lipid hydrolase [Salibacterium salarium]